MLVFQMRFLITKTNLCDLLFLNWNKNRVELPRGFGFLRIQQSNVENDLITKQKHHLSIKKVSISLGIMYNMNSLSASYLIIG